MLVQLAQKSVICLCFQFKWSKNCATTPLLDSISWLGGHGLVAELGGVWERISNGATYLSGAIQFHFYLKLEMPATLNTNTFQTWNQMVFSTVNHCWPLGSSSTEKNNMSLHQQLQEPCKCRTLFSFFVASSNLEYKQWDPGIRQKGLECFSKQDQQILTAKFQSSSEYLHAAFGPSNSPCHWLGPVMSRPHM